MVILLILCVIAGYNTITLLKIKRGNDLIRKKPMARGISEKNSRNLRREAYKVIGNNSTVLNCIDNVSGV